MDYRLHEADEPKPWEGRKIRAALFGKNADYQVGVLMGRGPDAGLISCDGCGRWQDFPPPHTFDAMRAAAIACGWQRSNDQDYCPVCRNG